MLSDERWYRNSKTKASNDENWNRRNREKGENEIENWTVGVHDTNEITGTKALRGK